MAAARSGRSSAWLERYVRDVEVARSNRVAPTCLIVRNDTIAKDGSANGTSTSVGRAGRIMRSNRQSWSGLMRPDRGGAEELPVHAQGRIFSRRRRPALKPLFLRAVRTVAWNAVRGCGCRSRAARLSVA